MGQYYHKLFSDLNNKLSRRGLYPHTLLARIWINLICNNYLLNKFFLYAVPYCNNINRRMAVGIFRILGRRIDPCVIGNCSDRDYTSPYSRKKPCVSHTYINHNNP